MKILKSIIKMFLYILPDKIYLSLLFKFKMGRWINWNNPKSFNEKIQWLKIHDRNPYYSKLVDKYEVKKEVENKIGKQYIVPNLGVWDSEEDIDFDALPDKFVLKCTHDSGGLVICDKKEDLDIIKAKQKLRKCLKSNYYKVFREWPYKNVKPRIIAEEYMQDSITKELRDYKFFCFNGKVKALFIATDRQKDDEETKFDFYDSDFKHLPFTNGHPNADHAPLRPTTFNKMKELAEVLSIGIPHVRIDFYEVDGKIYFGEFTFAHWGGFVPFEPFEWDIKFGNWIEI